MNERMLDSLLRISLKGPDVDKFPVADAVELWASLKIYIFFHEQFGTIFFIDFKMECDLMAVHTCTMYNHYFR